jgi:hypothetical protein
MAFGGMGMGFFLGSAGQAFTQAYQKSAELKLHQDQAMRAQQRELLERADKEVANGWNVINKTIMAGNAAGKSTQEIAADPGFGKFVSALRQHVKASGRDVGMFDFTLSQALSGPNAYDVANGSPQRQQQQAQQQQYEAAPLDWDHGTQPASFVGDQGQASGAGTLPPVPGPQQQQAPAEHVDFLNEIDGLTRAMSIAPTAGAKEAFAIRLREAVHEKLTHGVDHVDTHFFKDADGNEHAVFVNKKTRQIVDEHGNPWESQTSKGGDSDIGRIVDAIEAGRQPPVLTGFYRKKSAIMAEAERRGLDLTEMGLQYSAAQTEVKSLNGPQMVRFAGTAKAVLKTGQRVIDLAEGLHNGGVNWLNAIELEGIRKTAGNAELGTKIAAYQTAVAGYKSELAQTEKGGYDPTAEAFKLADKQIDENYGYLQMKAAVQESRRIISYRLHSIPNWETLGPGSTTNRYIPGGGSGTDQGEQPPPAPMPGLSGEAGGIKWREIK